MRRTYTKQEQGLSSFRHPGQELLRAVEGLTGSRRLSRQRRSKVAALPSGHVENRDSLKAAASANEILPSV